MKYLIFLAFITLTVSADDLSGIVIIQPDKLNITELDKANLSLNSGHSEITGGNVELPAGRYFINEELKFNALGVNNNIGINYTGRGKASTRLDFSKAPLKSNGLNFDGGVYYSVENLNVYNAPAIGIKQSNTPISWNHAKIDNVRINRSGKSGLEASRGFMGSYNQVFSSHNKEYGFNFLGLHTSLSLSNLYAASNGISGYKFNKISYSHMDSSASDLNGRHGYKITKSHSFSINGSGAEYNKRAGFYLSSSVGENKNISLDSLFGFKNNTGKEGWANLLHMKSRNKKENTATLTNSISLSPSNPIEDVIVDGEGAILAEGYNHLPNGIKSKNRGYIQHLPSIKVIRDFVVKKGQSEELFELISTQGYQSSYGGEIIIFVSNVDPASGSQKVSATYKLLISKGAQGEDCVTIASSGAISGSTYNRPSFTFELLNNKIRLTPVNETASKFYFEILTTGFIKVK